MGFLEEETRRGQGSKAKGKRVNDETGRGKRGLQGRCEWFVHLECGRGGRRWVGKWAISEAAVALLRLS